MYVGQHWEKSHYGQTMPTSWLWVVLAGHLFLSPVGGWGGRRWGVEYGWICRTWRWHGCTSCSRLQEAELRGRKSGSVTDNPVLYITLVPYCESVIPSFFFFLRSSETILLLLCMANSSSDLQACHLKLVWDHPREISKQRYLAFCLLLHPTLLCASSAPTEPGLLEYPSSLFCLPLPPPSTKLTGGFFTSSLSFFLFD